MDNSDASRPGLAPVFVRRPSHSVTTSNERHILNLLRRIPGASRADLARATGLTNQSLVRIIDDLCARGLVRMAPSEIRGRGQPAQPVYIREDGAYTLGISLMTDALALCIMDFTGAIVEHAYLRLDTSDIVSVLQACNRFKDDAFTRHGLNPERLLGAGVGITGYFIGDGNRVNPPEQLSTWALKDASAIFEQGLKLPVWMDNDGNVAAVGESLNGVGLEYASFAYLFFSVGFGGGVVLDRRLYRGRHGNAGEYASVLLPEMMSPNLENLRISLDRHGVHFAKVGDMLEAFDPDAPGVEDWLGEAVRSLDLVISAISAITDVDAIVFGGRLPKILAERLLPRLSYFNPPRRDHRRPVPKLCMSSVVNDAAMIGAAALPLSAMFYG